MGLRGPGAKPVKPRGKRTEFHISTRGRTIADKVISFIQSLPITSGILVESGETYTRFKLRSWQKSIIKDIYKTKRGKRVVRQALITMPRKNGKTGLSAALALAHLCGPVAEQRGQVYSAAADRHQAALIYNEMKAIINAVPDLRDRIIVRDFNKHLEDAETGSIFYALSSDSKTKHGFSASCVVYDELAQAPDRKLYDVLSTSMGGRSEPLMIVISTQSPDPHSIMSELVKDGLKIKSGETKDQSLHATIYTAPEDSDIWDEKTWYDCNPALDDFRSLEEMRAFAQQAKRIPAKEATFRLLYLNQPVNADTCFIPLPEWDACSAEVDVDSLKGRTCYAGLDLSTTTDISALSLVFPPIGDEPFKVLPFFWLPEEKLEERSKGDRVPYRLWEKQGFLNTTPGNLIDYRWILLKLGQCRTEFDIKALAFDRWGSQKIVTDLCDQIGFTIDAKEAKLYRKPLLVQFGQGFASMSSPTKELLTLVLGRKIAHGGNPVLRWMVSNAIAVQDPAGNVKLDKGKSTERIDGVIAAIMALAVALANVAAGPSVYETRGALSV